MRMSVIEQNSSADTPAIASLIDSLRSTGHEIEQGRSLADGDVSQAYLLCGKDIATLSDQLVDARTRAPDRLPRTLLVGVSPDFRRGIPAIDPGTVTELLEVYHLAGCFDSQALTSWQEAPSWFAGPKALMSQLQSNPLKMFQSPNYAQWFSARGSSLENFMVRYVSALDAALASRSPSAVIERGAG